MRKRINLAAAGIVGMGIAAAMAPTTPSPTGYTSQFGLDRTAGNLTNRLVADGGNPYFSLNPGTFHRYEGVDNGEYVELEHTVLDQTRTITFEVAGRRVLAETRIIEEREWIDGELAEVTLNYYARCPDSGSIFYFGEDVDIYEAGEVVSHEGSWIAGQNGAQPGLAMPGLFLIGSRYHQELAPGVAMGRSEHLSMNAAVDTPAGFFADCVVVLDTDPLEPDDETLKYYTAGVGLVREGPLHLVEWRP